MPAPPPPPPPRARARSRSPVRRRAGYVADNIRCGDRLGPESAFTPWVADQLFRSQPRTPDPWPFTLRTATFAFFMTRSYHRVRGRTAPRPSRLLRHGDGDARGGRFEVAAVVDRPAQNRPGARPFGLPFVAPRLAPLDGVPGRAAVHRHLDRGDASTPRDRATRPRPAPDPAAGKNRSAARRCARPAACDRPRLLRGRGPARASRAEPPCRRRG